MKENEPVHEGGRERENRIEKLSTLREAGVNPYPYRFQRTHGVAELLSGEDTFLESGAETAIAGRIMSIRGHGHTSFGNIKDDTGAIQFYIKDAEVSEEDWKVFRLLDVGDIAGLWGVLFKTRTGELTVKVSRLELLSKSLLPLPEKYHGLQDKELRYRRRYVDLIVNDEVMAVFRKRSMIIDSIRNYLREHNFLEVETPILQPLYGGASARPFVTHHNTLDMKLYLRIADELYLKRLIVGGMERVFEFSKDFRNEGMDRSHNPEFTMLECYAAYWDYNDMMGFVEEMYQRLCEEVVGSTEILYGEYEIDLTPPWRRLTFYGALEEKTGVDLRGATEKELEKLAKDNDIDLEGVAGKAALLDELFSRLVEPGLIQPTFIIDYPVELSPLAKVHRSEEGLVERFEPYIAGFEVANAFSELNDPVDQRARFEEQVRMRTEGADDMHPVDEDYIRALEYGMPPTGGLGVGIDRLVMLLTNSSSIRDVILFPQMRPEAGRGEK
ncbi:MAG: lysine--tRNA ligase [Candidatus Krumholzibacteriota bacterium]|nr:lysine--tRNA ligase [Candidatus Krumholzibacteriota bacterium]